MSDCDCKECRHQTWLSWLESDPGPWSIPGMVALSVLALCLAAWVVG